MAHRFSRIDPFRFGQRISVTRHPFAGTAQSRPRRLSLEQPAGLETTVRAHQKTGLLRAVSTARTGRRIAEQIVARYSPDGSHFQRPPFPLLSRGCWEHEGTVQGAPQFGAAKRTLDSPLVLPIIDSAGKGGRTVILGQTLTARWAPPFPTPPEFESETVSRSCPPPADTPPVCEPLKA